MDELLGWPLATAYRWAKLKHASLRAQVPSMEPALTQEIWFLTLLVLDNDWTILWKLIQWYSFNLTHPLFIHLPTTPMVLLNFPNLVFTFCTPIPSFQLSSFKGRRTQQKQRLLLYQLSQQGERETERGIEEESKEGWAGNEEGAWGHEEREDWEVEDTGKDQDTKGRN